MKKEGRSNQGRSNQGWKLICKVENEFGIHYKYRCGCGKERYFTSDNYKKKCRDCYFNIHRIDLTKKVFNNWTVLRKATPEEVGNRKRCPNAFFCVCKCGNNLVIPANILKRKRMKKCRKCVIKHGFSSHPLYMVWYNLLYRKIEVCDRWKNISNFIKDVGKRPKGLRISRINNNKAYGPDNFEWNNKIKR